jgi:hypothetical protein
VIAAEIFVAVPLHTVAVPDKVPAVGFPFTVTVTALLRPVRVQPFASVTLVNV